MTDILGYPFEELSLQLGHVVLLSNNPAENCGLRLLNNSHKCIGGSRPCSSSCKVSTFTRFENAFFLFHAADEERGFKSDGLIIQRSSENERHTLINLCFVAVWSDPFQII